MIGRLERRIERHWRVILSLILCIGVALRWVYPGDMEYKEDEEYLFLRLSHFGVDETLPWLGIPSGVVLRNPGMSVWVFLALGKFLHASTPLELNRGVALLSSLAILMIPLIGVIYFKGVERAAWLWTAALVSVNPFLVMYQRKIWAQSVMPFFSVLFYLCWLNRRRATGAFFWGLIGACLGQIHMSGFFFSIGFFLYAVLRDFRKVRWLPWTLGSLLGIPTLIPFLIHAWNFVPPPEHPIFRGVGEAIQLKFWVFWLTDPFGLHLGKALGVLKGNNWYTQLQDFFRYPLLWNHPTYGVAALHFSLVTLFLVSIGKTLWHWKQKGLVRNIQETDQMLNSGFYGMGILLTLSTVLIHRFYLLVAYPLESLWLVRQIQRCFKPESGKRFLTTLVLLQLGVSLAYLNYIHLNGGAPQGDYGTAYRLKIVTPENIQPQVPPKHLLTQ